jgi:D-alanyl-lipoteichoic acid acyltransferase DltB (MBOAT superfamily)
MFGFKFMENFNSPHLPFDTGMLGRWHISLSTLFRDYLSPLGNRGGPRGCGSIW